MVLGSDQPIRIKDRVMGWKVARSWGEGAILESQPGEASLRRHH